MQSIAGWTWPVGKPRYFRVRNVQFGLSSAYLEVCSSWYLVELQLQVLLCRNIFYKLQLGDRLSTINYCTLDLKLSEFKLISIYAQFIISTYERVHQTLGSLSQFISTHFVINSKLIQYYKGCSKIHEICIWQDLIAVAYEQKRWWLNEFFLGRLFLHYLSTMLYFGKQSVWK